MGEEQVATPDSASAQVKEVVTSTRRQPAAFAAGALEAVIDGAVLSMFSVTVRDVFFPFAATASRVTVCDAPSVVTATGDGHEATGLPFAVQVNVTVTFSRFQPAALGAGEIWAEMQWESFCGLARAYGVATAREKAIQYFVDGMKLTQTSPLYTEARDGMIAAANAANAGRVR